MAMVIKAKGARDKRSWLRDDGVQVVKYVNTRWQSNEYKVMEIRDMTKQQVP